MDDGVNSNGHVRHMHLLCQRVARSTFVQGSRISESEGRSAGNGGTMWHLLRAGMHRVIGRR